MTLEAYKKKTRAMPDTPGVYFFLDKHKRVLYIGKATSLRDRTRSYFASDLAATRGRLIVEMVEKAASMDWRETDSVLEALILEASLIRSHKPPYNSMQKDDKSFNYVVVTKEDFPRVLVARGRTLNEEFPPASQLYCFGPFPHGLQLREAMKLVRKIFPYRDTCTPCSRTLAKDGPSRGREGRSFAKSCKPCFNRQVGLCPGVCSGEVTKTEYRRIVRHIVLLFQGKKKELLRQLGKEMKLAAKAERFEEAARLRGQMFALGHINDVSLIKDEYRTMGASADAFRIEAYDAAHLAGKDAVGVMTVVEEGVAKRSAYRKFRLGDTKPGDDAGALREILSRRLAHAEWPLPKLLVVDGATAQMNAARALLDAAGISIPVVGVVKDEKHRPKDIRGAAAAAARRERDILLANAEAHRYAIAYHRARRRKSLF